MANSPQLPMLATNSTVKAWCHTGVINAATTPFTTNRWDNQTFVDGYNLRLDPSNWISPGSSSTVLGKALKFSFITPMRDTKYKIFIQPMCRDPRQATIGTTPVHAHALNSTQFPKLTTSFWIRMGIIKQFPPNTDTVNINQVFATTFSSLVSMQIRVVVL